MDIFVVLQTILALLLIFLIVTQSRGAGLGSAWGGEGELYGTKRGVEKILFKATVAVSVIFIFISLLTLFL